MRKRGQGPHENLPEVTKNNKNELFLRHQSLLDKVRELQIPDALESGHTTIEITVTANFVRREYVA